MRRACVLLSLVLTACGSSAPPPAAPAPTPTADAPPAPPAIDPDREPTPADAACRDEPSCITSGYCYGAGEGICVAASADDCRNSLNCGQDGRCTLVGDECVATTDDCAAHIGCTVSGRCTSLDGRCTVASSADCAHSEECTQLGNCVYHPASDSSIALCGK